MGYVWSDGTSHQCHWRDEIDQNDPAANFRHDPETSCDGLDPLAGRPAYRASGARKTRYDNAIGSLASIGVTRNNTIIRDFPYFITERNLPHVIQEIVDKPVKTDTDIAKLRAFAMSVIEGEGNRNGLFIDDPSKTHIKAMISVMHYTTGATQFGYCASGNCREGVVGTFNISESSPGVIDFTELEEEIGNRTFFTISFVKKQDTDALQDWPFALSERVPSLSADDPLATSVCEDAAANNTGGALPCQYDPPAVLRGDLNSDGRVTIIDLSLLLAAWGQTNVDRDINGDETITILDLAILLNDWQKEL